MVQFRNHCSIFSAIETDTDELILINHLENAILLLFVCEIETENTHITKLYYPKLYLHKFELHYLQMLLQLLA